MNNRVIIYIVLIIVVILSISGFLLYRSGKKSAKKPSQTKVGQDEAGTTLLTQNEIDKLKALAVALYNDMDGLNWSGWDTDLYAKVNLLSDTELIALSNIFNVMYEGTSGDTFLIWLKSEGFRVWLPTLQAEVNVIIKRLVEGGAS